MKKLILLAAFLVGCGDESTNYDVRIGALDPARCEGYMQLTGDSGFWRCEFIGGEARVDRTTPGVLFLHLETTPGFFSQVRATFQNESIEGQILIDGESVAFIAVPQ